MRSQHLSIYFEQQTDWCLVLLQVPKCFVLIQIFCARPKIYLHIVAVTNILCQTKRWFAFSKIVFCTCTKVFEEALNAVKFWGWFKKFGPAQNILEPVKGQGISDFHRLQKSRDMNYLGSGNLFELQDIFSALAEIVRKVRIQQIINVFSIFFQIDFQNRFLFYVRILFHKQMSYLYVLLNWFCGFCSVE